MGKKYPIPSTYTLREVYLMWLIALDPHEFAHENGLDASQLMAFRNVNKFNWGDFVRERRLNHE